jgi:hypothetical protein
MKTNILIIGLVAGAFLTAGCSEKPDAEVSEKSESAPAIEQPVESTQGIEQPTAESASEATTAGGTEVAAPQPVPDTAEAVESTEKAVSEVPPPEQIPTSPEQVPATEPAGQNIEAPAAAAP